MTEKNEALHPLVHVVRVDDTRTQIRLSDGESVTLRSNGFPLPEFLEALRSGTRSLAHHPLQHVFDTYGAHRSSLLDLLRERHALVDADGSVGPTDTLHALLDYVSGRTMRAAPSRRAFSSVSVAGSGVIADAARRVFGKTRQLDEAAANPATPASLKIVCADFDNFSLFQAENETAVEHEVPALFVWKSGVRILVGPLVRPRQSACFHCYAERRISNTHFIDEYEALVGQPEGEAPVLDDSLGLIGGLVEFLLARHVKLIANEVANLVTPGSVYTYDLVSGCTKTHPVVKLPRCAVCGSGREDRLLRAVRDLL